MIAYICDRCLQTFPINESIDIPMQIKYKDIHNMVRVGEHRSVLNYDLCRGCAEAIRSQIISSKKEEEL